MTDPSRPADRTRLAWTRSLLSSLGINGMLLSVGARQGSVPIAALVVGMSLAGGLALCAARVMLAAGDGELSGLDLPAALAVTGATVGTATAATVMLVAH